MVLIFQSYSNFMLTKHLILVTQPLRCATDVLAGFSHVAFCCGYGGWEVLADEVGCQAGEGR